MELKDFEYNFIDKIFDYDGLWGRKSKCGLKVVESKLKHIVIATDLYEENLGGTITEYCGELAQIVCEEYNLDKSKMQFIHHVPEVNSSLEFYEEAFYNVVFEKVNKEFKNPDWQPISRQEVEHLTQLK